MVPGDSVSAPTALSVEGVAHVETDGRSLIYEGESGEATRRAVVSAVTARRTRARPRAARGHGTSGTAAGWLPHPSDAYFRRCPAAPTANPPPPLVPWRAPFVPWAVLGRWFLRSYARLLFKARVLRKAGKPNCLEAGSARSVPTSGRCPARAGPGRYALIEHGAATTVYVRARPPHATAARHAPMHAPREVT